MQQNVLNAQWRVPGGGAVSLPLGQAQVQGQPVDLLPGEAGRPRLLHLLQARVVWPPEHLRHYRASSGLRQDKTQKVLS